MADTFGTGHFAVYVEWKTGSNTFYRYTSKSTRDGKLKEFQKNNKVKKATTAYFS